MECYTSPRKTLGLSLLGVVMTGGSYFCTTLEGRPFAVIVGWIGVVFFGSSFFVILAQVFNTGPQIVIDQEGIEDRRWSAGPIPWAEVRRLWVGSVESSRFLCVEVEDPEPYLASLPAHRRWLARRNPALGFPPITLTFSGLSPSLDEACDYLERELKVPVTRG